QAALMEGTNGALYGTTYQGGQFHFGTVFRIDKSGSNFSVVHDFAGGTNDGSLAFANLITASNGRLYGTTSGGGQSGGGVIFAMDYNGSNYMVLHHFAVASGPDGNAPYGALTQGTGGALYGTTSFGGTQQKGTIFQINPDGSGYTVLVNFSSAIGANPFGGLIIGSDGAFYGTASAAGPLGRGSDFRLTGVGTGDGVLTPPKFTGGASWLISGHGTANRTYTVQFATNLVPPVVWTTLGQATADSLGNWQYTDSTNSRARFYRTSFP
ncbi:MAG TPA: choice-of-anchor tandem repeat GloVer-containing protein, partial [Verrucomicrobiae bacterium]|nr:choice-of-anchor tandem repeat GloVer-containing protein [Verrucomicrobiae bacterium]